MSRATSRPVVLVSRAPGLVDRWGVVDASGRWLCGILGRDGLAIDWRGPSWAYLWPQRVAAEAIARQYGGTVREWTAAEVGK